MTLTLRIVIAAILYIYVFRQRIPCIQPSTQMISYFAFFVAQYFFFKASNM